MGADNYKILYSSKDQFYLMAIKKIQDWTSQLTKIENRMNAIVELDSFQGQAADSVKAYIKDVYTFLLICVRQTMVDYYARLTQYSNGFYDIDANIYAVLPKESLVEVQTLPPPEKNFLDGQNSIIKSTLRDIQDIIYLSVPSQRDIQDSLTDFKDRIRLLDEQIVDYESTNRAIAAGDVASLVASLSSTISAFTQSRGGISAYQAGDYAKRPEVLDLYKKVSGSMQYIQENSAQIQDAADGLQEVYAQQQRDHEEAVRAQLAAERKDEGTANMIVGGLAVVGGAAAIILTAGAATPVVVVAVGSGSCAMLYGASNIAEGAQDYYYGSVGDIETAAFNPIRDTLFMGSQSAYDTWGNISLTVASLCVPVGKAVNTVTGATGGVIAKKVAVTVGKELVQDAVVGEISDNITEHVADELDLNKTQTVIVKTVTEKVLDKTADTVVDKAVDGYVKHRDGHADGKLAEKMSYEDAKRYNQFMDDPDSTRVSTDPVDPGTIPDLDPVKVDSDSIPEVERIRAEAEAEVNRIKAETDAEVRRIEAETEAEVNRINAEVDRIKAEIRKVSSEYQADTSK